MGVEVRGVMGVFGLNRERVKALDGKYSVSDRGVVYSDGLPLAAIDGVGVNLHGERRKIAYLVARAFVPNGEGRPYVVHKNGDVRDNRAENLEWSERKEERKRGPKPEVRYLARYSRDGERLGAYNSVVEASEMTGISAVLIRNCLNGRTRSAGGYLWGWL